jgi:hypothetical protein
LIEWHGLWAVLQWMLAVGDYRRKWGWGGVEYKFCNAVLGLMDLACDRMDGIGHRS